METPKNSLVHLQNPKIYQKLRTIVLGTAKSTTKATLKSPEIPTSKLTDKPTSKLTEKLAAKQTVKSTMKPTKAEEKPTTNSSQVLVHLNASLCPSMTIHKEDKEISFNGMACHPRMPTEASCKYTAKSFKARPSVLICKDQKDPPHELCTISVQNNTAVTSTLLVKCNFSVCDKDKDMFIEDIDPSDGKLRKQKIVKGTPYETIENIIKGAARLARKDGFNFIFVNCTKANNESSISQMLTVLPELRLVKEKEIPQGAKINVNVILLDSISRAHFYRSLPKTVDYLRQKQTDAQLEAHLLEFELFQAIHGHTHENENAFFSGHLYPANYTKKQISSASTHPEILFGVFKRSGYQTIYMEDLCWKGYHGLMASFKAGGWKSLQQKLSTSNIDSTGITDSSCKILNRYGSNTQFSAGKNHQICFNGRHHHEYFLDYITSYFKTVGKTPQSKPLFSMMALNTAHDNVGVRVQTLDKHLMNFIDAMSKEDNTVTFIYADHGNTYTYYQVAMLEGRLEMYHPMMLGVIPKKLGAKLGEQAILNVRSNQHRLLNLLDLRAGLVELSKYDGRFKFSPTGIFGNISKKRVCDDLELTKASICICQGWYIPVENTTMQMAIAEFAIGQLNNKLQDMLMLSRKKNGVFDSRHYLFGSCQRLQIESFKNMRQRKISKGRLSTTMDIKVQSSNILQQEELFTVNVESNEKADTRHSLEMKLATFERISMYGPYEECADDNIELQLCICNKKNSPLPTTRSTVFTRLKSPLTKSHYIYEIVRKSSNVSQLNRCLLLIYRSFQETKSRDKSVKLKVYELTNICRDKNVTVHVGAVEAKDVVSSIKLPKTVKLEPRSIYFVTVIKAEKNQLQTKLNLHVRIINR